MPFTRLFRKLSLVLSIGAIVTKGAGAKFRRLNLRAQGRCD